MYCFNISNVTQFNGSQKKIVLYGWSRKSSDRVLMTFLPLLVAPLLAHVDSRLISNVHCSCEHGCSQMVQSYDRKHRHTIDIKVYICTHAY